MLLSINHWLVWCPGTGQQIKIGRDRVLGLGDASLLSEELLACLQHKHITSLAQAALSRNPFTFVEVLRSNKELELFGDLFIEWETYTKALCEAGITLQEESKDSLPWKGGDASGRMTS